MAIRGARACNTQPNESAEDEKQKYNPSAANGVTQGLACQGKKK